MPMAQRAESLTTEPTASPTRPTTWVAASLGNRGLIRHYVANAHTHTINDLRIFALHLVVLRAGQPRGSGKIPAETWLPRLVPTACQRISH